VSQYLNAKDDSSRGLEGSLLAEFSRLWAEGDNLWDRYHHTPAFHGYVSADYLTVYESLARLCGRAMTFLEWGSGPGIVTIMASRLGFEAHGIETEPDLIKYSQRLAQTYGPNARFAQGSFISDDFEWNDANGEVSRTSFDGVSAYDDLDLELKDFDLVYAYPWPEEHTLYRNIMLECGRRDALLLSYDAREGTKLVVLNDR